jgi:phosphoribosylformylglycinamidine cyclo-ligase
MFHLVFMCFLFNQIYSITYKEAGVDIDAGDSLVDRITPLAKATTRPGADGNLGGFSSAFDLSKINYHDPIIFTTTDGVGTKLKLACRCNKHDTIGIDLVAMNVNDLIVNGAEPVVFLDYFATSSLNVKQAETVIAGIAQGCILAGCALSGGETAEMPGMYQENEYDLAGFAIGIVERSQLLPKLDTIIPGDLVIGLASSGIHSNGYSLVRKIIEKNNINLADAPPFQSNFATLADLLLAPTIIYVKPLLPLIHEEKLKALAHITGGGLLENIPRVLPEHCAVELDMMRWHVPPVFHWLAKIGNVPELDMIRTFNMGIGMVAIIAREEASYVQEHFKQYNQKSFIIGSVASRSSNQKQVIITGECIRN